MDKILMSNADKISVTFQKVTTATYIKTCRYSEDIPNTIISC
jgi:hypothetical protein